MTGALGDALKAASVKTRTVHSLSKGTPGYIKARQAYAKRAAIENQPDAEKFWRSIGNSIKMRREVLRLTQTELAHVVDMSVTALNQIENGKKRKTSLVALSKCLAVLNIPLARHFEHLDISEHQSRLDKIWSLRSKDIDDEIKQAEERLTELKQQKASASRVATGCL